MPREIRRVPLGYEHPRDARGRHVPLFDGSDLYGHPLSAWQRVWDEECSAWGRGEHPAQRRSPDKTRGLAFDDWDGKRPDAADHTPELPLAERAGWCYYESTTEGTPLSPVFATAEELARWFIASGEWGAGDYESALAYVLAPRQYTANLDDWKKDHR